MLHWRRVFGDRQLYTVEALLKKAISNQEKLMVVLDNLKAAVAALEASHKSLQDKVNALCGKTGIER